MLYSIFRYSTCICLTIIFVFSANICAQNGKQNMTDLLELKNTYEKDYQKQNILLNGMEYINPYNGYIGTPYFMDKKVANSIIYYQGRKFSDKTILLDLVNQKLILESENHLGGKNQIELANRYIDSITIEDRMFMYYNESSSFLEILAQTKCAKLLVFREKAIEISKSELKHEFTNRSPKLFLYLEDKLYPIKRLRDLKKHIPLNKKSVLKDVIKHHQFSIRKPVPKIYTKFLYDYSQLLCKQ